MSQTFQRFFLHVGCGSKHKDQTTAGFNTSEWKEVRIDIDQNNHPDIVGKMTDMSTIPNGSVDAIFSSHNIEHLYPHEVPKALAEFRRILKPDGFAIITCPDLQSVCSFVVDDRLTEIAYTSPSGPITPLDIIYGHRDSLAQGNLFMAHRCGFTQKVLLETLKDAGFVMIASIRRAYPDFDLYALATQAAMPKSDLMALAANHFPYPDVH